ncbi:MAG: hypothetical protein IH942_02220 [Acidobacteria bacterium]|nr:hypothetical protein [Acidobacteriota bacterium]
MPDLRDEGVLRASSELLSAGGKGLNVARGLGLLGVPTEVLGFAAGAIGEIVLSRARQEGIRLTASVVSGETRVATVLVCHGSEKSLVVNPAGPFVHADEWQGLVDGALRRIELSGPAAVICTGSLPPGVAPNGYDPILETARARGIVTVIDASGAVLKAALQTQPSLVKVNCTEASQAVGQDRRDCLGAAQQLLQGGAGCAVVTNGSGSVVVVEGSTAVSAAAPRVSVRSSTGAGDAFLAAFVAARLAGDPIERCLVAGIAAGSASVADLQPGRFSMDMMQRLFREVVITHEF